MSAQDRVSLLHEGDLLFCLSAEENQITKVTEGIDGSRIDHVGIVHFQRDTLYVLEAVHQGVVLTPIDSFLLRRDSLVLVARLNDTHGVEQSVRRALHYVGYPYDYLDADGHEIFPAIPMSFHDKTGIVTPFWKDYYARRGLEVPEGEPGSNPGDLSRSRHLSILFRFF